MQCPLWTLIWMRDCSSTLVTVPEGNFRKKFAPSYKFNVFQFIDTLPENFVSDGPVEIVRWLLTLHQVVYGLVISKWEKFCLP